MKIGLKVRGAIVGDEMMYLTNAHVVCENGKIVELGEGEPRADLIEQHPDWVLCPCFINAHIHLGDSAFKDLGYGRTLKELFEPPNGLKHRLLRETPSETVIQGMRETLLDLIASGTYAVADFREGGSKGVKLSLEASKGLPIRVLTFQRPDHSFTAEELEGNVGSYPQRAVQELGETAGVVWGVAPSSPNDLTDSALIQLNEYARRHKLLKGIHAAEDRRSRQIAVKRSGISEVSRALEFYEPDFLVHMIYSEEADLDLVVSSEASVVCCPRANRALGLALPPIRKILDKGINVALGTDNVMLNPPDLFSEMEFVLKAFDRISPKEVLQMVTINAARTVKIDGEVGSLKEGKEATFMALNFGDRNLRFSRDHVVSIVHRARRRNVDKVYIKGEVTYDRARGIGL